MKYMILLLLGIALVACSEDAATPEKKVEPKSLIQKMNGVYTEFYEDGKTVKITGELDQNDQRHGKWTHYNEQGTEMGFTFYMHGKKHGHSLTKYPNGAPYFYGEYRNDTMVGIWKTYDKQGDLVTKDYGGLDE